MRLIKIGYKDFDRAAGAGGGWISYPGARGGGQHVGIKVA